MVTRRDFLQNGAMLTAVPIIGSAGVQSHSAKTEEGSKEREAHPMTEFDFVVTEQSVPEVAAFAEGLREAGVSTRPIQEDITVLWYDQIARRQHTLAFAGFTLPTSLLMLEVLARDVRMRVAFRAEHRQQADGSMLHILSGPANMVNEGARLMKERWPGNVLKMLSQFDSTLPYTVVESVTMTVTTPAGKDMLTEYLTSWVIAPVIAKGNYDGPTT